MTEIAAIVFDLDGTLVDTLPAIVRGVNYALERLVLPPRRPEEVRSFVGGGVRDMLRQAVGRDRDDLVEGAVKYFTEYRFQDPEGAGELYPEVTETLERLEGKRLAVLSNGRKKLVDYILDRLGIAEYFSIVVGGDEEDCRKPSPCPLADTLQRLELNPGRTLMVGDMSEDIQAGKEAGTATAAALYGYGERAELEELDPDYLLEKIGGLFGIEGI